MYTIKQASELVRISYETLKFYCKEGLVPNIKRDAKIRIYSDMAKEMRGFFDFFICYPCNGRSYTR